MAENDPALIARTLADEAYPPLDDLTPTPPRDAPCDGCSGVTDPSCCQYRPPYPEFGYSTGLGSDDDLPGMWEHADFE